MRLSFHFIPLGAPVIVLVNHPEPEGRKLKKAVHVDGLQAASDQSASLEQMLTNIRCLLNAPLFFILHNALPLPMKTLEKIVWSG